MGSHVADNTHGTLRGGTKQQRERGRAHLLLPGFRIVIEKPRRHLLLGGWLWPFLPPFPSPELDGPPPPGPDRLLSVPVNMFCEELFCVFSLGLTGLGINSE